MNFRPDIPYKEPSFIDEFQIFGDFENIELAYEPEIEPESDLKNKQDLNSYLGFSESVFVSETEQVIDLGIEPDMVVDIFGNSEFETNSNSNYKNNNSVVQEFRNQFY